MICVTINGTIHESVAGATILDAINSRGLSIPALCHDSRVRPQAYCRLCTVEVDGLGEVTACNTPLADGMVITTESPALTAFRRLWLEQLAERVDPWASEQLPDKLLHRWLHAYGIAPAGGRTEPGEGTDASHPNIVVDMDACIQCFKCLRVCEELQGQFIWHALARGDSTHFVPDSGSTLAASSCVSCGACVDVCPTAALTDRTRRQAPSPKQWTRTVCAYCGVGCELEVGTAKRQIVGIRPALEAPVNQGHLCVKGRYAHQYNASAERMVRPQVRRGGAWKDVRWNRAIDLVAKRLSRIVDEYGSDAVGVLGSARATNEENYLAQKFARAVLGTNNVDCCARVCHAPTAAAMKSMLGTGAATNSFADIEHAQAFLLVGTNATENHPVVGARIKQRVLAGVPLVVIDPRRTELAALARVHLAPRPGTNVPLLNAMAQVMVSEGLVDRPFLDDRVGGFAGFRDFIQSWTPERAAQLCGVPADDIREAARLYARAKPAMCFHGLGMTEHVQGTEGVKCLVNLVLLTGNIGIRGAGMNPLRGQNNVQGAAHMGCEPGLLTGAVPINDARERFERVWRTAIPTTRGMHLLEMVDAAARGQLRALWVIGYDVYLTLADAGVSAEALRQVDFVIVQDLFLTRTAEAFGHVLLPAASNFEKDGTFMNSERRVQRVRKALEPPRGARPDWRIICDLARAMGRGDLFDFASPREVWDEIRSVWPDGAGMSYDRLDNGGLQWPCPTIDHPGTAILHTVSFAHSTVAPLACIDYEPSPETTTAEYPYLLTTGRNLYQFNAGTMSMRTTSRDLRPTDTLDVSPADAATLKLDEGGRVTIRSRHGEASLPVRISTAVKPGELFATFHDPDAFVNRLTSPHRDSIVGAPEYKLTAVQIQPDGPR